MKAKQLNMSSLSGRILGTKNRVMSTYRKFKRLIQFIPTIWNTDDYDYSHTIDILMYQLERQAKYMEDLKWNTDWKYDSDRIRLAIRLLDIGVNHKYAEEVEDRFTKEYGQSNFLMGDPIQEDTDIIELATIWWSNVSDSAENAHVNEQYFEEMNQARIKSERAYDLAWRIISKDLQKWWV